VRERLEKPVIAAITCIHLSRPLHRSNNNCRSSWQRYFVELLYQCNLVSSGSALLCLVLQLFLRRTRTCVRVIRTCTCNAYIHASAIEYRVGQDLVIPKSHCEAAPSTSLILLRVASTATAAFSSLIPISPQHRGACIRVLGRYIRPV